MRNFRVIDNQTGEYPDLWKIATEEDWAKHLMYCDMEGFAISEDGFLILMDECGGQAYCPSDRFTIVWEENADAEDDIHYVILSEWAFDDESDINIIGVAHTLEKAKALFNERLIEEKSVTDARGLTVFEDTETCFDAGTEGEYCVSHTRLYIQKVHN